MESGATHWKVVIARRPADAARWTVRASGTARARLLNIVYPAAANPDTLRDVALHWRYTVVQYSFEARALLLHTRVCVSFTINIFHAHACQPYIVLHAAYLHLAYKRSRIRGTSHESVTSLFTSDILRALFVKPIGRTACWERAERVICACALYLLKNRDVLKAS